MSRFRWPGIALGILVLLFIALAIGSEVTGANEYHFVTHWQVQGTVAEVQRTLEDPRELVRWWPAVYLKVQQEDAGDANGVGRRVRLHTKGWMPYTLKWEFHTSEVRADGSTIIAEGDFVGRGIWTFVQAGPNVDITYDWKIRAEKPLVRHLSLLMKPIFRANHHWAMDKGEKSLGLELQRTRAKTAEERAAIPEPPGATSSLPWEMAVGLVGFAAIAFAGALLLLRRRRAEV